MSSRIRDAEDAVRNILSLFPEARSNDKVLMVHFWRKFDRIYVSSQFARDFVERATTPETLTRLRRKIQNEKGDYLPRDEVLADRNRKAGLISTYLKET
jgi:hypothetical protein